MLRSSEQTTFADLLNSLGTASPSYTPNLFCAFAAIKGTAAKGELMVVGRAVNTWYTQWEHPRLGQVDYRTKIVAETFQRSQSGTECSCPMLWVSEAWGSRDGYNTKRSAFWRTIRRVTACLGIANVDDASWPSVLIYSNLYKMAPASGGNPSAVFRKAILPLCAVLLRLELQQWSPRRLLVLTGSDWADPFLNAIGFAEEWRSADRLVQATGRISLSHQTSISVVVARHPQGKPEESMANQIVDAFNRWRA